MDVPKIKRCVHKDIRAVGCQNLFRFFMRSRFSAVLAKLVQDEAIFDFRVLPALIVVVLALGALKMDEGVL